VYFPETQRIPPGIARLTGIQEVKLAAPGGETLIAWYGEAAPGKPTLLYFHGNAGGLRRRADRIRRFQMAGLGIFILAYRGYSGSTGKPSERANVADALLAYEALRQRGVPDSAIAVYGESLGTGVSTQLAAARPVAALILDAPYTSLPAVAQRLFPMFPIRPFLLDRYRNERYIKAVRAPILILHGARDLLVPAAQGRALFGLAPEPKEIAIFPHGGHWDLYNHGALSRMLAFLEKYLPRTPESAEMTGPPPDGAISSRPFTPMSPQPARPPLPLM
jgi:fermentation-respiration switch protein FrsA (DUF1100 family)